MHKGIRQRIFIGLILFVTTTMAALTPLAVSASYVSDHSNDAAALEEMWELYTAASYCLGSNGRNSFTINLSNRSGTFGSIVGTYGTDEASFKNAYNLNDGMFNNKTRIYSASLESRYRGYKDGKLYCSEGNYIVDLLKALSAYDTETRNKIVCDGSNSGIFKITVGYSSTDAIESQFVGLNAPENRPAGWPENRTDCSGNLNKVIEYLEQRPNETIGFLESGETSYPFVVTMTPSTDAASHFQKVVGPLVGRFDEPDGDTRKMMLMWRYYNAFQAGCGQINNGNTTPPAASSSNMIGIYDPTSDQVYYHAKNDINSTRNIYYNVSDSATLTCEDLAGKINDLASVAQKIAKDAQKADCEEQKKAFLQTQLNAASTQYNHATDAEARQKAKDYIDKYTNWQFWEEDANGEIVCREIESFTGTENSPETKPTTPPTPGSSNNNSGINYSSDIDECHGAAGSLGWILCPVLKMVSEGVDNIYEGYVQKVFLEVDSTELKAEKGYAVYDAWTLIRNMANIIFVILFMVVIFSQLTGIGLTNYGIKKILPKLIMVAVLVNMSFLLCQFAVDISNVLGYSLNKLFDSLGGTVTDMGSSLNNTGSSDLVNWVETFGLLLGITTAGSWMPTFILVLVSAAISVFFGAIVLAARLAGIYILIVLSPAAIVCYALPNSKKIFDRWFKLFIALLIVFPICGALMGGGNFASTILLEVAKSL